jgi:hypothetical protein
MGIWQAQVGTRGEATATYFHGSLVALTLKSALAHPFVAGLLHDLPHEQRRTKGFEFELETQINLILHASSSTTANPQGSEGVRHFRIPVTRSRYKEEDARRGTRWMPFARGMWTTLENSEGAVGNSKFESAPSFLISRRSVSLVPDLSLLGDDLDEGEPLPEDVSEIAGEVFDDGGPSAPLMIAFRFISKALGEDEEVDTPLEDLVTQESMEAWNLMRLRTWSRGSWIRKPNAISQSELGEGNTRAKPA